MSRIKAPIRNGAGKSSSSTASRSSKKRPNRADASEQRILDGSDGKEEEEEEEEKEAAAAAERGATGESLPLPAASPKRARNGVKGSDHISNEKKHKGRAGIAKRRTQRPDLWMPPMRLDYCRHPEGCFRRASYGHPETLQRLYCSAHKLPGLTNVKRILKMDTVSARSANFTGAKQGEKAPSKKRRCQVEGCEITATYGLPDGGQRPTHCASHKGVDYVDLMHKRCQSETVK